MPKISVVMAVHDDEATLEATLDSILRQTEPDFELIAVDDASRDTSPSILARRAAAEPRLRLFRNETNLGLTRSLVIGCAAARGTYIARHDADDLSLPARFERQAALLDAAPDIAFVACWVEFDGPGFEYLYEHRGSGRAVEAMNVLDPSLENPMLDGPPCHGSAMFRRDAYERAGGYRPQFYYGQDWDLWYRLAEQGKFRMVPEVLYRVRVSPDSISVDAREAQMSLAALSLAAARARHASQPEEAILARAAAVGRGEGRKGGARAAGLYFIGERLRRNGDVRARRYLGAAVRASPLAPKVWIRWLQSLAIR